MADTAGGHLVIAMGVWVKHMLLAT